MHNFLSRKRCGLTALSGLLVVLWWIQMGLRALRRGGFLGGHFFNMDPQADRLKPSSRRIHWAAIQEDQANKVHHALTDNRVDKLECLAGPKPTNPFLIIITGNQEKNTAARRRALHAFRESSVEDSSTFGTFVNGKVPCFLRCCFDWSSSCAMSLS